MTKPLTDRLDDVHVKATLAAYNIGRVSSGWTHIDAQAAFNEIAAMAEISAETRTSYAELLRLARVGRRLEEETKAAVERSQTPAGQA